MADRLKVVSGFAVSVATLMLVTAAAPPASRPAERSVALVHPGLACGVLHVAAVAELPKGVLVRCGDVRITEADLSKELESAPAELRPQLQKGLFFVLEKVAAPKLLLEVARRQAASAPAGGGAGTEEEIIGKYLDGVVAHVKASDAEVKEFYESNKDQFGGAPLDQIREPLSQLVLQQKQQEAVEEHIRTLGRRLPIEVDANWTGQQAKLAMDNPVDKARAGGKPTMVDFGAAGCRACDMMTPILAELQKKYEGKANVLFVHVREEQILAARYGIRGIPSQVFFDKQGKEVFRHSGFYPQAEIEKQLAVLEAK